MATLHKELWRYHDNRGATATVFRTSASEGRLLVIDHLSGDTILDRVVALGPFDVTSDNDREWFEQADRAITNLHEEPTP